MKLQAPSSKLQGSSNHPAPKPPESWLVWGLRFGISLVLGCWSLELSHAAAQSPSAIISTRADGQLTYETDAHGNRIPDFSTAGYAANERAIPTAPIQVVVEPKPGDSTARIQAAIDYVSALPLDTSGLRGAVLLLIIVALMAKRSSPPAQQRICGGCRRVMLPVWTKCLFCGWAPGARLEFILGPMANQTLQLTDDVTTIELRAVAGLTYPLVDPSFTPDGNHLLADDPTWRERAELFAAKVRDVTEYLASRGDGALGRLRARVTYQSPCHLAHAQRITQEPRALLRRVDVALAVAIQADGRVLAAGNSSPSGPAAVDFALARIPKASDVEDFLERMQEASATIDDAAGDLDDTGAPERFAEPAGRLVKALDQLAVDLDATASDLSQPELLQNLVTGAQGINFESWDKANAALADLRELGIRVEPIQRH